MFILIEKIIHEVSTCISALTFLATLSGWSLASLSKVARKFLHLIFAVSGVICWPIELAEFAGGGAATGCLATGAVGRRGWGAGCD